MTGGESNSCAAIYIARQRKSHSEAECLHAILGSICVYFFGFVFECNESLPYDSPFLCTSAHLAFLLSCQVLNGFHTTCLKWLSPHAHKKTPQSSRVLRTRAHTLVLWLFNDVLVPLIRHSFYVTESSLHRSRVFYYRKQVWARLEKMALKQVCVCVRECESVNMGLVCGFETSGIHLWLGGEKISCVEPAIVHVHVGVRGP